MIRKNNNRIIIMTIITIIVLGGLISSAYYYVSIIKNNNALEEEVNNKRTAYTQEVDRNKKLKDSIAEIDEENELQLEAKTRWEELVSTMRNIVENPKIESSDSK